VADALSRKGSGDLSTNENGALAAITNILPAWYEDVYTSYEKDCKLKAIILNKLAGEHDFIYKEGILRYKGKTVVGQGGNLRAQLVKSVHDSYVGRHAGFQNTYRRLKTNFHWYSMKAMVKKVVEECNVCKQAKVERVAYPGLLQPLPVPGGT